MKERLDWENQRVTQKNREPMHSPWGAWESAEEAAKGERGSSGNVLSLDGTWKFHLAAGPDCVPEEFYKEEYFPETGRRRDTVILFIPIMSIPWAGRMKNDIRSVPAGKRERER